MLLSHATSQIGSGFGFGLHEALNQMWAVSEPLAVVAVLARQQSYSAGFAILMVPALVGLILVWLQRRYPNPQEFEPKSHQLSGAKISQRFGFI